MKKHDVRRLVNLSSWALTPALLDFVSRRILIPLFAKNVMADKERAEALLFISGIDYVNVRPGRLLNSAARGGVRASLDGRGLKQVIARADLAGFMIEQIVNHQWVRRSVYVGY
jgi:hypothetical protein